MIEIIQFSESILGVSIYSAGPIVATQGQRSIKLDLGKGSTITELHYRQFVDFIKPFYLERSGQISQLVFELLCAHTRVGGIDFDLFHRTCKRLEISGAPDILVQLTGRAIEGASRDEDIALTFRKCKPD